MSLTSASVSMSVGGMIGLETGQRMDIRMGNNVMEVVFIGHHRPVVGCDDRAHEKIFPRRRFAGGGTVDAMARAASARVPEEMAPVRGGLEIAPDDAVHPFHEIRAICTMTFRRIAEWSCPQYCVQKMSNVPTILACTQILLYRPGTTSFLMRNTGM